MNNDASSHVQLPEWTPSSNISAGNHYDSPQYQTSLRTQTSVVSQGSLAAKEGVMAARKRARPNPKTESESPKLDEGNATRSDSSSMAAENEISEDPTLSTPLHHGGEAKKVGSQDNQEHAQTARGWYGGTWPRLSKAVPVTQVARESISAARATKGTHAPVAASPSRSSAGSPRNRDGPNKSPSMSLAGRTGRMGGVGRAFPAAATTTKLNITSTGEATPEEHKLGQSHDGSDVGKRKSLELKTDTESDKVGKKEQTATEETLGGEVSKRPPDVSSSRWLDWWSNPGSSSRAKPGEDEVGIPSSGLTISSKMPTSGASTAAAEPPSQEAQPTSQTDQPLQAQNRRLWLGYWGWSTEPSKPLAQEAAGTGSVQQSQEPYQSGQSIVQNAGPNAESSTSKDPSTTKQESVPSKSSTWAFWSRVRSDSDQPDVGEVAVADTPSQSCPQAAEVEAPSGPNKFESPQPGKQDFPERVKRASKEPSPPSIKDLPSNPPVETTPVSSSSKAMQTSSKQALQKPLPPNILLPSFRNTYRSADSQSLLQQITRYLVPGKQAPPKHVALLKDPPRVKKAVAIGVHGYFPSPLVRTLLGQPTGTSLKFADATVDAIKRWTSKHKYECEIEKIALEGEGKIGERVDMLWKLLFNWVDHIHKADLVLIACHSQGVPVAIMLVAKLIEAGCISAARVGVCAMAGVNLGPFPDYKSRLFSGSAGELFEFTNTQSAVSKRYEEAIRVALQNEVRILYVGSIDDQLVPLESSTYSTLEHPYIYRAVFVDGRVHAPDFITHLVGFALKLRNLGVPDHGLIRELSSPLAGSLYTGEGHSRLYDDQIVYDLAVEHALETTSVGNIPLQIQEYEPPTTTNPFILPWSMRGLLEEEYVRTQLRDETAELLAQFEKWRPTSKVLKDVKFRLEAVKSKL